MGLLSLVFGESPRSLRQVAPTDGWCAVAGLGRMSLVWPWQTVDEPSPLLDSQGRPVEEPPLLELRCPRTDVDASLMVWSAASPAGQDVAMAQPGAGWARSVAAAHGVPVQASYAVNIGGLRGYLVRFAAGQFAKWRVIVPRPDGVVHVMAECPAAQADDYWVQIETMLATWEWSS